MYLLRRHFNWKGRTCRKDFWIFLFINFVVLTLLQFVDRWIAVKFLGFSCAEVDDEGGIYTLTVLYSLGMIIPSLIICIRRLHDTNRSGWWLLIGMIPFIGAFVLLIFYCLASTEDNRFGRKSSSRLNS
ncbi:DUF805 domain-containing protein [Pseudomonas chlororaphis]|uniref:DUF805 domain-containing protein n=1 Tax=Pseudomonas chlororaphis TaxID=587753 RepID=UPI003BB00D52